MAVIAGTLPADFGGSGSGYGDGDGYGSGDGYGDGSGDGYGSTQYSAKILSPWINTRPGARVAFWRASPTGSPANGGRDQKARAIGDVETVYGPLEICSVRALHGTLAPWKWAGERLFVVALYGEVVEQEDKLGALKREILAEIVPNPF